MSGADSLDFAVRPHPSPVGAAERAALMVDPGFGRVFTDHMVTIRYADGKGWYEPQVVARAPIPMDPASAALHYGQEIFEGLKAYRTQDGGVSLFRPEANAQRFRRSAARLAMAELPDELFLESLAELVRIDHHWVPDAPEASLYLRPFMFATESFLGVRPSTEYLYVLIASPVSSYFSGGVRPVTLWISEDYTRAAPGGTGAAKCGGNYGASLAAQAQAVERGCDQVIFLDAVHRRYVDELGGMNVVFVYDDYLVTPRLNGSILPGVTRDSILTLAKERGLAVKQRRYSIDEWRADAASGVLREVFACGTAAVITPIASVRSAHGDFTIGDGGFGPVSASLRQELVDIQRGRIPDRHGWVRRVWDPPAAASVPERIDRARRPHRPATAARSAAPTVRAGRRGTGYPVAGRISSA